MLKKILIVEDDKELREYLRDFLRNNNYSIDLVTDGASALNYTKNVRPDLVVLDLGLPDVDGKTVCVEIKKNHPDLPILMLTARSSTNDVVTGFNLGADDYMSKPFVADELVARIRARLRNDDSDQTLLQVADLEMNTKTMEVKRAGNSIRLTKTEFDLLQYLMKSKGKVLTRENILNRIWLYSPDIESRVVDVYVGYLRKKIDNGYNKKLIKSIRGFGYTLRE